MKRILTIAFVATFVFTSTFGQRTQEKDGKLGNAKGKYVAFLVGANNYKEFDMLDYPVSDITKLRETLREYSFAEENIIFAPNPSDDNFLEKTNELKIRAKRNDNLLVYISMHGILNQNGKYYWLPIDAKISSSENWIFVRDFLNTLESLNCKHILLIIDSCYGGSIFDIIKDKNGGSIDDAVITQETIDTYLSTTSALAMTSGTKLKTVPDQSHFFKALNYVLLENENAYLPAQRLFAKLKTKVYQEQNRPGFGNTKIEPQLSKIPYLNDEGGQFVFYKKGGIPAPTVPPIPSDESHYHQFKLANTIYKENINLNAGDRIEIIASGTITVGQFLGNVTPRGRVAGLFGLSIEQYNIVPKFPHGSLMYRISPSQSWVLCGDGCEIRATKSGNMTIEFTINDNNTGDNSGNFDITLKKL